MKMRSALDVFMDIDEDKDDLIDPSELSTYISSLNIKLKQEEIITFLNSVDAD